MLNSKFFPINIYLIFLFGFLTTSVGCDGQNKDFNSDKILSAGKIVKDLDKEIRAIFHDSKNQYWFGSKNNGIYRYNKTNGGDSSLVLFTEEDGLCSNSIVDIQEDKSGNMYFDTQSGVSKFDGHTFSTIPIVKSGPYPDNWELQKEDLWFTSGWDKNGPLRYDGKALYQLEFPVTDRAVRFYGNKQNGSFSPFGIYSKYCDSDGHLWFGTTSLGVCLYDGKSLRWLYEKQLTKTPEGGDFGMRSIVEDDDGYFWFCNSNFKFRILKDSNIEIEEGQLPYRKELGFTVETLHKQKDNAYFLSFEKATNGDLWMVNYEYGAYRYDGENSTRFTGTFGHSKKSISIYIDKIGAIWLLTQNDGVYKFEDEQFVKVNL